MPPFLENQCTISKRTRRRAQGLGAGSRGVHVTGRGSDRVLVPMRRDPDEPLGKTRPGVPLGGRPEPEVP
jgi:hypothetical protein